MKIFHIRAWTVHDGLSTECFDSERYPTCAAITEHCPSHRAMHNSAYSLLYMDTSTQIDRVNNNLEKSSLNQRKGYTSFAVILALTHNHLAGGWWHNHLAAAVSCESSHLVES